MSSRLAPFSLKQFKFHDLLAQPVPADSRFGEDGPFGHVWRPFLLLKKGDLPIISLFHWQYFEANFSSLAFISMNCFNSCHSMMRFRDKHIQFSFSSQAAVVSVCNVEYFP